MYKQRFFSIRALMLGLIVALLFISLIGHLSKSNPSEEAQKSAKVIKMDKPIPILDGTTAPNKSEQGLLGSKTVKIGSNWTDTGIVARAGEKLKLIPGSNLHGRIGKVVIKVKPIVENGQVVGVVYMSTPDNPLSQTWKFKSTTGTRDIKIDIFRGSYPVKTGDVKWLSSKEAVITVKPGKTFPTLIFLSKNSLFTYKPDGGGCNYVSSSHGSVPIPETGIKLQAYDTKTHLVVENTTCEVRHIKLLITSGRRMGS